MNGVRVDTESAKAQRNFNGSMIKTALYSKPDIGKFNGSHTVTQFLSNKKLGMYRNNWLWNESQTPQVKKKSRSLSTSFAAVRVGADTPKMKDRDPTPQAKNLKRLLPYLKIDDDKIPAFVFRCIVKDLVKT
jgi:hypothetical protein